LNFPLIPGLKIDTNSESTSVFFINYLLKSVRKKKYARIFPYFKIKIVDLPIEKLPELSRILNCKTSSWKFFGKPK